jgi:cysteine desulfurase/selenocysteine lyase
LSFVHVSNALGTVNPVQELVAAARAVGAKVLLDGAQSVPHMPVDVQALDVDFLAFSSHKMCGPTGIGVLYGKRELLEAMPQWQGGGDMIREVRMSGSKWNSLPYKFEAGTPAVAEGVGLGAAVDYLSSLGMEWVYEQEQALVHYAYQRMSEIEGLRIIGPEQRAGLVAFTFNDIHPHDLSAILDQEGVAVRAGHHCAMPVHDRLNVVATARASFYFYNTPQEVDLLCSGLEKAVEIFTI